RASRGEARPCPARVACTRAGSIEHMTASPLEIVGLFPSATRNSFGGVQASGRDGWSGIVNRVGTGQAHAFSYEAGTSKTKAVLQALGHRRRAEVVLVWHLHLLKLLPVLDSSSSRIVLFLHGIEAWRRHDPLIQL